MTRSYARQPPSKESRLIRVTCSSGLHYGHSTGCRLLIILVSLIGILCETHTVHLDTGRLSENMSRTIGYSFEFSKMNGGFEGSHACDGVIIPISTPIDYSVMTVVRLRGELVRRRLSTRGRKHELVRLFSFLTHVPVLV